MEPSPATTIGTIGSGYVAVLLAKLAAHRGHGRSWMICPPSEVDAMGRLTGKGGDNGDGGGGGSSSGCYPNNLELVPASDASRVDELLSTTDALLVAADDVESVVDPAVVDYLLDPGRVPKLRRVVAMSRNLNGMGMGLFVAASRRAANSQVWDNSNKKVRR